MASSEASAGADEARSLLRWLTDSDGLRGAVTTDERPPEPGTLGPVLDGLTVAIGSGGAATALTTALVAWIRSRRSDVTVKMTRPDGASIELSATRIRSLDDQELKALIADAARIVEGGHSPEGVQG